MSPEEKIMKALVEKFNFLEGKYVITRPRRIFMDVPFANSMELIKFLESKLEFNHLCTITGLDTGETFQVIYHIANKDGILINVKVDISKAKPVMATVTGIFQGATLYERELIDMFGIEVTGLPPGHRYPLPDSWPAGQYPLRKDWDKSKMSSTEEGSE